MLQVAKRRMCCDVNIYQNKTSMSNKYTVPIVLLVTAAVLLAAGYSIYGMNDSATTSLVGVPYNIIGIIMMCLGAVSMGGSAYLMMNSDVSTSMHKTFQEGVTNATTTTTEAYNNMVNSDFGRTLGRAGQDVTGLANNAIQRTRSMSKAAFNAYDAVPNDESDKQSKGGRGS
jgi:hypothetical protein